MKIEQKYIIQAREHFANLALRCIQDAKEMVVRVNDIDKYIKWQTDSYNRIIAGDFDHTFTHQQYAYYLQTGESVPFLPIIELPK